MAKREITSAIHAISIDGAVVIADMTKQRAGDDDVFAIGDVNREYCRALYTDGILWASNDKKSFVPAISVMIGGKKYTSLDFRAHVGSAG